MKLAPKIALWMVALLGVVLAISGHVMIASNFGRSMDDAAARDTATHLAGREALRRNLVTAGYEDITLQDYDITEFGRQTAEAMAPSGGMCAVLNAGGTPLFNNLPSGFGKGVQTAIMAQPQPGILYYRFAGSTYLVLPSALRAGGHSLWLISAFDITPIFRERTVQSQSFLLLYAIVLAATALAVGLVVGRLLRPLRQLGAASRLIAQGAYAQRTGLAGDDEIAQLAARFDEMAAAIEEKIDSLNLSLRQREDFMAAFTHELKTPMTAMMGYAALLKKGTLGEAEQAKALDYIHGETRRLEDLSQKLLMLLGLSDEPPALEPVRLEEVMDQVRDALAATNGHTLRTEGLEDGGCVMAEPGLLADLLINLVQNAAHAKPDDGVVLVRLTPGGEDHATLAVADRGRGIPKDALARVMEPFYRVDAARAAGEGGSGLGLALCARIAALHGSELEIESEEGRGTTVSLRLRRCPPGEVEP